MIQVNQVSNCRVCGRVVCIGDDLVKDGCVEHPGEGVFHRRSGKEVPPMNDAACRGIHRVKRVGPHDTVQWVSLAI